MTGRQFLVRGGAVVAALFLTVIFTVFLIPARQIEGIVAQLCQRNGYTFSATRFGKTLPLGIAARGVTIGTEQGPVVHLDRAAARLALLPLLAGKVKIVFDGNIGAGRIDGELSPRGNGAASLTLTGIPLADVPFFKTVADADLKGELRADAELKGLGPRATGRLRLEVRGAEIRGVKISGMPLPDASYDTVRGMIRFGSGRATIDSFTLQGADVYLRLKGEVMLASPPGNSPLNLSLELMPQPAFLDRQKLIFLLMAKYLVTPGDYRIPVRGTLGKPLLL
ncbi:type II secretion system protein GspN [Geotalea uraniireducens]|uniref:Type II secretion system protein GspN n=1 Tax=Geotalea uraniireducens TaxID=351604 RepID=A0ABM8EQE0_9BACT|nr:type II secretion system protein GspN [Geotalea uraniireducens]BDV44777.1 type II secretion system protein GspN [Geotalea uraniireducens]